jgi:transposase
MPRTHGYASKGRPCYGMQDLIPKLPANSVIIMDNATFHKRQDIKDAILKAEHVLEFLPAYSPDLNLIEQKWAHAKALRKKYNAQLSNSSRQN